MKKPARIKMNLAWFLYYGRAHLHMSRKEILMTKYGEMKDMVTCMQIERGDLVPAGKTVLKGINPSTGKKWTYDEAMRLS